ncbi:hypothetical protein J8M20_22715 [Pseudoalteromonas luteoviolacea]|nr:hypothetical protein [Pseudoalteromonas luteoviolacea]MBQ4814197.1 hypothetical protein [Pseudoalteromonas luteoviolacea]
MKTIIIAGYGEVQVSGNEKLHLGGAYLDNLHCFHAGYLSYLAKDCTH